MRPSPVRAAQLSRLTNSRSGFWLKPAIVAIVDEREYLMGNIGRNATNQYSGDDDNEIQVAVPVSICQLGNAGRLGRTVIQELRHGHVWL